MTNKIINRLRILFLILVLAVSLFSPMLILAHPGGLDKLGCHTCKKNCSQYGLKDGEYHCHNNQPSNTEKSRKADQSQKTIIETTGVVSSVYDGDTIYVMVNRKRYKIRLIGIDAPEINDKRVSTKCLAKESKKYLEKFIKGKSIVLKSDSLSEDQDKYKRLLRYIYLKNGTSVNEEMIKNGYARAYTIYPFQHTEEFGDFENQARESRLNIWGGSSCFNKKLKK